VCPTVKIFEDDNVCLQRGDNTAAYHAVETSNTFVYLVIKISQHSKLCCVQDDKKKRCAAQCSYLSITVCHKVETSTQLCALW
jgi:hypothetical protein